jgi:hypothetical protein
VDDRHVMWSNENLDLDDWREDVSRSSIPVVRKMSSIEIMCESKRRLSLRRACEPEYPAYPSRSLLIADLGLWNGRRMGYKEIPSGNIRDCLYLEDTTTPPGTWTRRATSVVMTFTMTAPTTIFTAFIKTDVSESQKDRLKEKLYEGTATRADIVRITRRLGDDIGKVYGWTFPTHQRERGEAR